jgi:lysozyme
MVTKMSILGCDVYSGDGDIDWAKVKKAGYDFAFIKASQGTTIKDSHYEINKKNAQDAGLLISAYEYFTPSSDAYNQARFFLDCVGDFDGMLPLCIDAEKRSGLSVEGYSKSIQAWLDVVEDVTGVPPIIYVNRDYAINSLTHTFGRYPLWLAQWQTAVPSGKVGDWDKWTFWQNSASASVSGLQNKNGADVDVFDGSFDNLKKMVIGQEQTTPIKIVNKKTGVLVANYDMVNGGNHIVDQGKVYVK